MFSLGPEVWNHIWSGNLPSPGMTVVLVCLLVVAVP